MEFSVASMLTRLWDGHQVNGGSIYSRDKKSLFSKSSKVALEPTQLPIQCIMEALLPGLRQSLCAPFPYTFIHVQGQLYPPHDHPLYLGCPKVLSLE